LRFNLPQPGVSIIRAAPHFDATIKDPEFIADAKKARLLTYGAMTGAEVAAMTLKLAQTPAAVVERIAKIFKNFGGQN